MSIRVGVAFVVAFSLGAFVMFALTSDVFVLSEGAISTLLQSPRGYPELPKNNAPRGIDSKRFTGEVYSIRDYADVPLWDTFVGRNAAMEAYMDFHDQMCRGLIPPKFMLTETADWLGLGNRLEQIQLAMFVAMLFGRALVVEWEKPVPVFEYFNISRSFNWAMKIPEYEQRVGRRLSREERKPEDVLELIAEHGDAGGKDLNADLLVVLQFSYVQGISFFPRIMRQPQLRHLLPRSLGEWTNVVAQAMFFPNDRIYERMDRYLASLRPYERLITIQWRTRQGVDWELNDRLESFSDCARHHSGDLDTKFVLITDCEGADRDQILNGLRERLGQDKVVLTDVIPYNQDPNHKQQPNLQGFSLDDVVFDFWLIGEGDVMLLSTRSSFGSVGSMRHDPYLRPPIMVGPYMRCSKGTGLKMMAPWTEGYYQTGTMYISNPYSHQAATNADLCRQ